MGLTWHCLAVCELSNTGQAGLKSFQESLKGTLEEYNISMKELIQHYPNELAYEVRQHLIEIRILLLT